MYLCARTFDFASFSVLIFDFGIVPTMWYILCLHLLHNHGVFVTQNATNLCVHTAWIETKLYTTIHRGRIVMVAGLTITYANCAYHWDKDCQWLAAGRWFSLCTPISSTNKKNHITEILLKVVLNTITQILWGCYFPSLPVRWKSNYIWLDRKKFRDNFHWSG